MGLFARFTCMRRDETANDLAQTVRDLLKARHVVEVADLAAADRLMMIAPAGHGWLLLFDHVERPSEAFSDDGSLLRELNGSPDETSVDIMVADSDDMILSLVDGSQLRSQLEIDHRGLKGGALEAWQRLLAPGKSIEDIRKAFAKRTTFVEEHLPALEPLFGIDLAVLNEINDVASGRAPPRDAVLLRLKAVAAPGETVGPPKLAVDEVFRANFGATQIPRGLVTHLPAFCFYSRGGCARGLEVRLTGSALDQGLVEAVSAKLQQRHPIDRNLNRNIQVVPAMTPAGPILHFPDLEVLDWIEPDLKTAMRASSSLHDLLVFVYCRGLKVGDGELSAEGRLVTPGSAPVQTSHPVRVLPEMWRPLKGSEQPHSIHDVLNLSQPTRMNGFAVLRDQADEALRHTLETWRSLIDPGGRFTVAAAMEPVQEYTFFSPADLAKSFKIDLSKKRQAKWDKLLADLPSIHGLRIVSDYSIGPNGPPADYEKRYAARIVLQYTSAAAHPRLPAYAARLGHVSLSVAANRAGEIALISLMRALASKGMIGQAYVAAWNHDDEPRNTLYEGAANIFVHQRSAQGWGTRYLRAVADRMWLGPEFAAMLPDRSALERVAIVSQDGETLAIERRPNATLRDLELCLEPMLASQAESQAFWDRFAPRRPQ